MPSMRLVETFPDGQVLYEHCSKFGFEGVVPKRIDRPYVSGLSKYWVKVKCAE
jgi:bifunctional non-homologous end joining protein LigD